MVLKGKDNQEQPTEIEEKPMHTLGESQLKLKIAKLGCQLECLKTKNSQFKHEIAILNERLQTYISLNEVLQMENVQYKRKLGLIVRIEERKKELDALVSIKFMNTIIAVFHGAGTTVHTPRCATNFVS